MMMTEREEEMEDRKVDKVPTCWIPSQLATLDALQDYKVAMVQHNHTC